MILQFEILDINKHFYSIINFNMNLQFESMISLGRDRFPVIFYKKKNNILI